MAAQEIEEPVFGWYSSRGAIVEGTGVHPEWTVEIAAKTLSDRKDDQMASAIDIVSRL